MSALNDLNTATLLPSGNIKTPRGKLSYPSLLEPRSMANDPEGEKKYSCALLIPPGADLTVMRSEAQRVAKEKWPDGVPKNVRNPFLRVGDLERSKGGGQYPAEFADWTLIRCSSKQAPDLVDHLGQAVTRQAEVYPGRFSRLSVRPFAYDQKGNRGVSFGLQNAQLLDHDTPMAGTRSRAEDDFESVSLTGGGGTAPKMAQTDDLWG